MNWFGTPSDYSDTLVGIFVRVLAFHEHVHRTFLGFTLSMGWFHEA